MQLGRGIQPDNTVQTATTTFGPKDTIYLSVTTEGIAPQAVLATRWTFGPKDVAVHEESKPVSPPSEKPMRTEFHISKPSPWPAGEYKVVLTVDGQPSQTADLHRLEGRREALGPRARDAAPPPATATGMSLRR